MTWSRRDLFTGRWLADKLPSTSEPVSEARGPVHWLEPEARVEPKPVLPSVAKVMPFSCLNQLGGFCGTCVEQCPVPGAIAMKGRVPVVDPVACTGCRECAERCPAPGGAILIVPEGT